MNLPVLKNCSGVVISSVKGAEDGNGIIVRLAEYHGQTERFTLALPDGINTCFETDMKETPIKEYNGREIQMEISPFEIKTIKLNR